VQDLAPHDESPSQEGFFFYGLWSFCLVLSLGVIWTLYSPGFEFGFSFDDAVNLSRLGEISDLPSALSFVFSGNAGPTGRPLSLLSFLLNASAWPHYSGAFVRINLAIHLVNAMLVVWLAYRLCPHLPWRMPNPAWFALMTGVAWASCPILVSTNLMVVQRMNTLSAFFSLAGLLVFAIARQSLGARRSWAIGWMSAGVVMGTLLGGLSKENGFLLPLVVLSLEFLLLSSGLGSGAVGQTKPPRWWVMIFLIVPSLLVIAYIVQAPLRSGGLLDGRGFDATQRLLTESRILFRYLHLIVLPLRSRIGPYQDDFPISEGLLDPPVTFVAAMAWLLVLPAIVFLRKSSWGLLCFALGWFLVAQLMESTVLNLELYFEHRNYLPSVSIVLLIVACVFARDFPYRKLRLGLGVVLLANSLFVLRESALVWGQPLLAAQLWHIDHPGSLRALQDHGAEVAATGKNAEVFALLDAAPPRLRESVGFRIVDLRTSCQGGGPERTAAASANLREALARGHVGHAGVKALIEAGPLIKAGRCEGFDYPAYLDIIERIAGAAGRASVDARSIAHEELGRLWYDRKEVNKTLWHYEQAYDLRRSLRFAAPMVAVLVQAGFPEDAKRVLRDLRKDAPLRPYLRGIWLAQCDDLEKAIDNASHSPSAQPRQAQDQVPAAR
jgi:hypothetical protein